MIDRSIEKKSNKGGKVVVDRPVKKKQEGGEAAFAAFWRRSTLQVWALESSSNSPVKEQKAFYSHLHSYLVQVLYCIGRTA